ncbi:hypothetical protein H311_00765 [Anncaliia algerae PRA109]|nr:hypothetical protein H311_00765 [Anncaliia algerae PRA109]
METNYYCNLPKLGGENIIVEIDESKFGKRKFNRGHYVEGVWVFGIVERTPQRKILLFPVEKRDRATLFDLINKYIKKQSIIYSDGWRAYNTLHLEGYYHYVVNHSIAFVNPLDGVHTNTIEGNCSSVKASIPK